MLKLNNITGGYLEGINILNGLSLEISQGDTLAILGQNGCGKSTLAKAILNILPYFSGDIIFNGNNLENTTTLKRIQSGIGFFMQGGKVFAHLNSLENLRLAGCMLSERVFQQRFDELKYFFTFLQSNKVRLQASYLSGGEKHQLALAMVLIIKPLLLILDEPSAGLSPANVENMYRILTSIRYNDKITVLLIEQNIEKAIGFCNNVALLKNGILNIIPTSNYANTIEQINKHYFNIDFG